jgi:hypothetical protein
MKTSRNTHQFRHDEIVPVVECHAVFGTKEMATG